MIQRIQSVYLLGACILLQISAFTLSALPGDAVGRYRLLFVVAVSAAGLAGLAAAFLFKNRNLQLTIVRWIEAITVLLIVALLAAVFFTGSFASLFSSTLLGFLFGLLIIPIVAATLFHRAAKAIQRDIDLIRSMDRIR